LLSQYIGYRHVGNGLHPSWTFPAAAIFAHLPVALAESFVLGTISYFMAGLTYEAGRYFYFVMGASRLVGALLGAAFLTWPLSIAVLFLIDVFAATLFRQVVVMPPLGLLPCFCLL